MYLSAQPPKICYYIISSREHILLVKYKGGWTVWVNMIS